MTTKHVVQDGLLGKVARKQWEIQRRILEGTLNPEDVVRRLQFIIENSRGSSSFTVEQVNYTLSEKTYDVRTRIEKDFCEYATKLKARGVFGKTFLDDLKNYSTLHYGELQVPSVKTVKRRLRLAKVTGPTPKSVVAIQARQSGHELADPWDLIAFFEQSPFREIIHGTMTLYALGGSPLMKWWDAEGTSPSNAGVRQPCHIKVQGHGNSWELEETDRKDDPHYPLNLDYFLIREQ